MSNNLIHYLKHILTLLKTLLRKNTNYTKKPRCSNFIVTWKFRKWNSNTNASLDFIFLVGRRTYEKYTWRHRKVTAWTLQLPVFIRSFVTPECSQSRHCNSIEETDVWSPQANLNFCRPHYAYTCSSNPLRPAFPIFSFNHSPQEELLSKLMSWRWAWQEPGQSGETLFSFLSVPQNPSRPWGLPGIQWKKWPLFSNPPNTSLGLHLLLRIIIITHEFGFKPISFLKLGI